MLLPRARDSYFQVVPAMVLVPSVTDTIPIHLSWGECFQQGQLRARTRRRRLSRHSVQKWDPDLSWTDLQKILCSLSSLPPILMVEEVARVVEEEVAPLLLQMHSR